MMCADFSFVVMDGTKQAEVVAVILWGSVQGQMNEAFSERLNGKLLLRRS